MKSTIFSFALSAGLLLMVVSCQKTTTAPATPLPPAPSVDAGPAQIVTLPVDSVRLNGTAHDTASRIVGYAWSELSGPNTPVIADNGNPVTIVRGLVTGTYVFQLMAVDSIGHTGVDTVSIQVLGGNGTVVLHTFFPGTGYSPYELMFLANASSPGGNSTSPELLAEAWTVNGIFVTGRSFFKFNLSPIPAGAVVTSATLVLFSDTLPQNGDLVHANYGSTNDFWIQRISSSWDQTLNFNNQPTTDTTGQVHVPQTGQPFLNLSVDVTTMVNNMLTNGNYGFTMRLNTEQLYNSRIFCSSAYSDTTRYPYVTATYKINQ